MNLNYKKLIVAITSLLIIGAGCKPSGNKDNTQETKQKKVSIYYSNWAETIAMTKVTELALEEVGIEVETYLLTPGAIYASLAKGDGDIFLESWLPQTHEDYWNKYGEQIDKVGIAFDEASTGLVVPKYVDINSIEELNANKEKFGQKIIGIGSGAGVYKDTDKAIDSYNLDFTQITSSGPAMMASLKKAVMRKEWVVITGWKPHYKWAKYDLKYLKDPKNIYPSEKAYILTRKNFTEEYPGVGEFLKNFHLKGDLIYDLMLTFEEIGNEEEAAKKWYNENKTLMQSWMPESWTK